MAHTMSHTMWICTICSLLMAVEDGPAHIGSDDHKARLVQSNAGALASRIKELTLLHSSFCKESISVFPVAYIRDQQRGITGYVHVSAETFTHTDFPRYSTSAFSLAFQRQIESMQTRAKIRNALTVSASSSAAVWTCRLCNREMSSVSKVDHLAGRAHARKLISELSTLPVPLHVNSTMSGTPVVRKAKEKRLQSRVLPLIVRCKAGPVHLVTPLSHFSKRHHIPALAPTQNLRPLTGP